MSKLDTEEERSRIHLAESVTIPHDNYIEILDEVDALRTALEQAEAEHSQQRVAELESTPSFDAGMRQAAEIATKHTLGVDSQNEPVFATDVAEAILSSLPTQDRAEQAEARERHVVATRKLFSEKLEQAEADNAKLIVALEVILANSINPAKTMTKLGLEETVAANHWIAEQALKEVTDGA